MNGTPTCPGTEPEIDEATRRVIEQRLAPFDEDRKTAVYAKEALERIRKSLQKHPAPR